MRRLIRTFVTGLILALTSLVAAPAFAQKSVANFTYFYDVDSTSTTYCVLKGMNDSPIGQDKPGPFAVKTSGSSVTITERDSGSGPFTNVAVGDLLVFRTATGTVSNRVVRTRASAASITVDTAINLGTSSTFSYRTLSCGTTDADGWVSVPGYVAKNVTFELEQGAFTAGGVGMDIECRGSGVGANPIPIWPGSSATSSCGPGTNTSGYCIYTTAGAATGRVIFSVPEQIQCSAIRVGLKISDTDDADASEATTERVTAFVELTGLAQSQ